MSGNDTKKCRHAIEHNIIFKKILIPCSKLVQILEDTVGLGFFWMLLDIVSAVVAAI